MSLARAGAVIAAASALALSLSGCGPSCSVQAGACPQQPTAAADGPSSRDNIVCVKETETGSHIADTRCYRRDELDERREVDRSILQKAQMNSNRPAYRRDQ